MRSAVPPESVTVPAGTFEAWKVGRKGIDDGLVVFILAEDRKIKIEVGYGLEGRLTDLTAGRIIRDRIVPEFRAGRFDQRSSLSSTVRSASRPATNRANTEPPCRTK